MIRKAIIASLTLAAIGSACLWAWMSSRKDNIVFRLFDLPTLNLAVSHIGTRLVVTRVVKKFEFPDPVFGRSVVQYDLQDERGAVHEMDVTPAQPLVMPMDAFFHRLDLLGLVPGQGWAIYAYVDSPSGGLQSVIVSFWPFIPFFAFYPLFTLVRGPVRRWRRKRRGRCVKCGYNLTGNESGLCPGDTLRCRDPL